MVLQNIDITKYDTLLLDRDGVINMLRHNDYVKCWEEFEFSPGILATLAKWNKHFKYILVVTNQRGVGRGVMTEADLWEIHRNMCLEIEKHGGRIDKIYYCTATEDNAHNRKPNIGMWETILNDFPNIKTETTLMIGDSDCDIEFGKNCGIYSIKIDL